MPLIRRLRLLPLLGFALVALTASPLPAQEQSQEPTSEAGQDQSSSAAPSTEQLESLLGTLKDDAARQRLISDIEALIDLRNQGADAQRDAQASDGGQDGGNRLLSRVSDRMDVIARQLGDAAGVVLRLPEVGEDLWEQASDPAVRDRWFEVAGKVLAVVLGGLIAGWIVSRVLARPVTSLNSRQRDGLAMRLLLLLVRSGLKLLPIAAFAAVAYGLLPVFEPQRVTRLVALALVNAHILASLITVVGDFVFAARAPGLRIPRISDETAYYLRIWLRRLVVIGVYGYFTLEAALLLGLEPGAQLVAQKILGAVLTIMAAVFVLQNRGAVAGALRGGKGEALYLLRARLADVWHLLALLYLVAGYLVWALNIPGGFEFIARATVLTFVVLGAVRLIYVAVVRILDRGFRLTSEMRERFPLLEARANRYLPMVRRGAQIVIFGFGALALLQVWGLNIFGWLASDFGRALGGRIVTIVLIVVLALAFWEVVSALIERFLRQRSTDEGKSSARLLTLLPLIRNVVRVALAVLVALIVLSEIGIDIGPLLAGAGVVGLAIGFGAQALVKDVITGVFILLEDAMSVGDWVEVGGVTGGVESMSIRSVRLRDLNGVVHVVPFGDIAKVTNMNREFGYALMDIGVAYRENVDDVIEVLKEIGADIREDETFGPLILDDMEVFGLNNLGDSAVEIRVRLKTKPLRQWGVRREFLRRTKKRFDELGIEIPFPHQTLYFGVDKEGKAPPARVRLEEAAEKAEAEDRKRKARKRSKAPEGGEEEAAKTPAEEEPDENPKPGDIA